jgi:hypothetical protein
MTTEELSNLANDIAQKLTAKLNEEVRASPLWGKEPLGNLYINIVSRLLGATLGSVIAEMDESNETLAQVMESVGASVLKQAVETINAVRVQGKHLLTLQ